MSVIQCPLLRNRTSKQSGFISPVQESFTDIKAEMEDYLHSGTARPQHDVDGLLGRQCTPPHITTTLKLRNALETCVVLEPLNISTLKTKIKYSPFSCGKRKPISDQGTTLLVEEMSPVILPCSQTLLSKKKRVVNLSSKQQSASILTKPIDKESHHLWYTKNIHLDKIVLRCKEVIDKCLFELNNSDVPESDTFKNFIRELEKVSSKTELPKTIIAFMGGTGTGKSTLVNALLDSSCVLPTSDDRACTSVVVEVVQNIKEDMFEADVEFLQKTDWFKELQVLLEDLMCKEGSRLIKPPESSSDMYVSYCKVKAVYGKIDTFECLTNIESVNQWLGKTHHLTCSGSEGEKFQDEVEKFIITKEHGKNKQSLWPIIKHVRIKLPNSDVCSSGASLVDLPGIGDSNPARNKIAKEFLKECHSVWMINAMPRATDDITTRDLLDQGLRRQLFMDGKMESLAFVCTMSDRFSEHNTIRTHNLDSLCRDLKVQKCSMEMDKRCLEQNIKALQDTEDVSEAKARMWELHENIMKKNYTISKICAKSRNEVCIRHIQRLFRDIKRQSSLILEHPDGEESENDVEVDMEHREEHSPEEEALERDIRVFCCSSTEYQKITGINYTDGPPVVFEDAEDTQIPAIKEYVHELTYVRRQKGLEHLVRSLGRCLSNFLSYIRNGGRLDTYASAGIEATIEEELCHFQEQIQSMIKTLGVSLEDLFRGKIMCLVLQGATNAKLAACTTCDRWGPPVNKIPQKGEVVGLHWRSYRATVQRKGIFTLYSSKTDINFNHDLADPIYKEIENEWNRIFNSQLPQLLDKTSEGIYNITRLFIEHLCKQLSEYLSQVSLKVMRKQREINRMLTPYIQFRLDDVYTDVANQTGKGSTENMKRCMREGIDKLRHTMFDEATDKLLGELESLQGVILKVVAAQCSDLEEEMRKAFDPLWKSTTPSVAAIYDVLSTACEEIRVIYADANLENTDEIPPTYVIRSQVGHVTYNQEQHFKKQTMSRWECSVQNILRNGTAEEIMKVLSTCPNYETSEVLRPFVNESDTQRKILLIITELLQKRLLTQGYNVSIWPGYLHYKSEHVLFCTFKKQKPQVGRFFNMDLVYLDFYSLMG